MQDLDMPGGVVGVNLTTRQPCCQPYHGSGHLTSENGEDVRMTQDRYVQPGWFTRHVFNGLVRLATAAGVSIWGSRILQVRGRTTGELRETPVNPLTHAGARYLVAPRGVTQWVRNLRITGEGSLRLGRRTEHFRAVEIPDTEKLDVLRAYLRRWKAEVGVFFGGVGADSPDEDLRRIAPNHPVFRIEIDEQ
jgi:deazaflavin-dependent oxidoreductase (nitroreductase family)